VAVGAVNFEQWVAEYLKLRETQQKLKAFMAQHYEGDLEQIGHRYFDEQLVMGTARVELPCEDCRVQVTSLIDGEGWYFEWTCSAGWGCSANTFGWSVPLDFVERYLADLHAT
jgi:hypothetical protein